MISISVREGKSGYSESIFAVCIGLCTFGIFGFDSFAAYGHGNSTYLSIPLACAAAFLVCFLLSAVMKRAKRRNLYDLSCYCFGKIGAGILTIFLSLMILLRVSMLICRFITLMHSFFFHDSKLSAVGFYFMLVPVVLAFFGFETINRTAKILGILAVFVQILLFINSYSGFESYKLYPVMGDGITSAAGFSFGSVSLFLPVLLISLTAAKGENGVSNAQRIMLVSSVAAFLICAATQFLLALSGTYDDLSRLFMPLYRISMMTGDENFIVRLDKICAFVWTAAALYTSGYIIYGLSHLHTEVFNQKDIRPSALFFGTCAVLLALLQHSGKAKTAGMISGLCDKCSLFLLVPIALLIIVGFIKSAVHRRIYDI